MLPNVSSHFESHPLVREISDYLATGNRRKGEGWKKNTQKNGQSMSPATGEGFKHQ